MSSETKESMPCEKFHKQPAHGKMPHGVFFQVMTRRHAYVVFMAGFIAMIVMPVQLVSPKEFV